ncbi:MAG TPA: acyl-CoA dehydrogenase, partial [Desulfotomaculum sp.]|nr:acyl-CoA dehydrogenase [Desulfotomaculum sp.]HCJ79640.1 acyl-CoA dehydrogenase [Desulfotomaculum sp.]
MDFDLNEEQKMLKTNVRRFLEKEIQPLVEEYESKSIPITKKIIKKVLPFGFIGGLLPEEIGGGNLDHITYFLMIEELSRVWPSLRAAVSTSNMILTHIYESGTDKQKEKFIEPLLEA